MASELYLGYRNDDANTPFGKFFNPEMAALPAHVVEALQHGPQGGMALSAFDDAASVADEGYQQTENGYGVLDDGSYQVSVRTDMPGVTPRMWSWWFGWHGCDTRRYKLWHPRAHLSAAWKDGTGRHPVATAQRYIGRWSLISEYIGSTMLNGAIQFVAPAEMGCPPDSDDAVAICARLGAGDAPVDVGGLSTTSARRKTGREMRSRFWMGGPHIAVRNAPGCGVAGGAPDRGAGTRQSGIQRPQSARALRAGDESPRRLPA